jgi:hypothetical protein
LDFGFFGVVVVLLLPECEPLGVLLPPHPATTTAIAVAASSVRVAVNTVRFIDWTPAVAGRLRRTH